MKVYCKEVFTLKSAVKKSLELKCSVLRIQMQLQSFSVHFLQI